MITDIGFLTNNFEDLLSRVRMGYVKKTDSFIVRVNAISVSTANTPEPLSANKNPDPFLLTEQIVYFSSDKTADVGVTLLIEGVVAGGHIDSETIVLNGQNAVASINEYSSILRMQNISTSSITGVIYSGTEEAPAVGVPALNNTLSVIPRILEDDFSANRSLTCHYQIPKNYSAFLFSVVQRVPKGDDVTAYGMNRPTVNHPLTYGGSISSFEQSSQINPRLRRLNEGAQLLPYQLSKTNSTIDLEYNLLLIHNDYIDKYN